MKEEHYYESNIALGNCHYDLENLKPALLKYFEKNSRKVSEFLSEGVNNIWEFHKNGVSIHMQTIELIPRRLHYIDLKLVSEITPTLGLEEELTAFVKPFKK